MSITPMSDRKSGSENFLIECDAVGCRKCLDAMNMDFIQAVELAKSKGWKVRKVSRAYHHYCPGCADRLCGHSPRKGL
jgi:hypothetical protein